MKHYDVVIVGGGIVGGVLALCLGQLNYHVLLIEKKSLHFSAVPDIEVRTLALSWASQKILEALNIGSNNTKTVPLKKVEVSVQAQFGQSHLIPLPGFEALGYVVSVSELVQSIYARLNENSNITIQSETQLIESHLDEKWQLTLLNQKTQVVQADLLVACDGANSPLREMQGIKSTTRHYSQTAVLSNIELQQPLNNIAIERFLKDGAIALLPWRENYATCIITVKKNLMTPEEFIENCQKNLGKKIGKIKNVGTLHHIPLEKQIAHQLSSQQFLLMGNAAHNLHPIAAQGLNLSLRDIWQFRTLSKQSENKLSDKVLLETYQRKRKFEHISIIQATDKIARFMSGGPLPLGLRALGLTLFDCMPPLKKQFTRMSMGL